MSSSQNLTFVSGSGGSNPKDLKTRSKQRSASEAEMEGTGNTGGEVKHILLAKFKDGLSEQQIEELIKGYDKLANLIEPMKAFKWALAVEDL